MTRREQVLQALFEQLSTLPITLKRNDSLPERVPTDGLLILRDGEMGEPEILLSPLTYVWEHEAHIEVFVATPAAAERDRQMDALLAQLGALIKANPTLGGVVEHTMVVAPKFEDIAPEGAAAIRACVVPVLLNYTSSGPLD
jgi:hypothetical protein